jgi:hypothetical protein
MSLSSVWRRRFTAISNAALSKRLLYHARCIPFDMRSARGETQLNQVGAALGKLRWPSTNQERYRHQINQHARALAGRTSDVDHLRAILELIGASAGGLYYVPHLKQAIRDVSEEFMQKHLRCLADNAPCDCRL